MRSVRSELASVLTVLAVPAMIAAVFPFSAFSFRPAAVPKRPSFSAAFVKLSPDAERLALQAAKASWRGDSDSVRRLRADLFLPELPDDTSALPVLPERESVRRPPAPPIPCGWSAFLPSRRAAPPRRIERDEKADDYLTFPRSELLKID